ncbi:MAG: hypothetical protein WD709_03970, partial [Gammaproteobacteria bacterium]
MLRTIDLANQPVTDSRCPGEAEYKLGTYIPQGQFYGGIQALFIAAENGSRGFTVTGKLPLRNKFAIRMIHFDAVLYPGLVHVRAGFL